MLLSSIFARVNSIIDLTVPIYSEGSNWGYCLHCPGFSASRLSLCPYIPREKLLTNRAICPIV